MNALEAVYHHFYRQRRNEAESHRVRVENVRIVSVGNLTTGGTGKTPAVQWLARRLKSDGFSAVVVGRGYGGAYSLRGAIVSGGKTVLLNARQAGDEAILHARALPGIPVVIGRDRVAAVKMAVEKFAPQVVILDDGFQYWSLARDFDLVLLDARRPFGNGMLLPTGRLREPKTELARADGVLLTRADTASATELQRSHDNAKKVTSAPVFVSTHSPVGLRDEGKGEVLELGALGGRRVAALSALADNAAFFQSLRERGANIVSTLARRDHHQWREKEVRDFAAAMLARKNVQAIVTTEKDAVKIEAGWVSPLPLLSLQIELKIENEAALWQLIKAACVEN